MSHPGAALLRTDLLQRKEEPLPSDLAKTYSKYIPPGQRLPPLPRTERDALRSLACTFSTTANSLKPFISDKEHWRAREGGWNPSCVVEEPEDPQTWKRAETVVKKVHDEGSKLCEQCDEHREGVRGLR